MNNVIIYHKTIKDIDIERYIYSFHIDAKNFFYVSGEIDSLDELVYILSNKLKNRGIYCINNVKFISDLNYNYTEIIKCLEDYLLYKINNKLIIY